MNDSESCKKMMRAHNFLELLVQGEHDIAYGDVLSQEEFFANLDREFEHQNSESVKLQSIYDQES